MASGGNYLQFDMMVVEERSSSSGGIWLVEGGQEERWSLTVHGGFGLEVVACGEFPSQNALAGWTGKSELEASSTQFNLEL